MHDNQIIEIKQAFDEATMWVSNEYSGEIQIQVRLITDDGESNAVIWLTDDQRRDLIRILQKMGD